ncbi:MAG: GDP-fucose synthetase [Gammaproteobacteria bacterium RIFCSPLOWO2_02_FULL_61_13]|nr:MAG: GDP-fucose synthetase [Gammaproteobacteria bacterium RIFCSPLOWO2_02_FULL_61_13]
MKFDLRHKRVFVTGHRGMIGSALLRRLQNEECEVLSAPRQVLDLARQEPVEAWFAEHRPDVVIHAAARVGGIHANNQYPAEFIYENLATATHVIHAAWKWRVQKLLFLGAACVYPRDAPQPLSEESLLTAPLEPTNEWFAVAKIAGIKLCQAYRRQHGCDFISVIPANAYGPGDNFRPEYAHVIASLLQRAQQAHVASTPALSVWGTGKPRRDFIYVDDLADAIVFMLQHYSAAAPINIGSGTGISIAELARLICNVVGYRGRLDFDTSRPDGMPLKILDATRMRDLGWVPGTTLDEGLQQTYRWYLDNPGRAGICH